MGQQREQVIDLRDPGPRTAFVLTGGATRGASQVGMLAALADRGIVPDVVVGTSVGAMNGAAYVGDATPEGIAQLDRDWNQARATRIFPLGPRSILENMRSHRGYVVPNHGLRDWIASHLHHERLEDFPIPLHVVATRVDDGRAVRLSRGDALTALLASTAIPGVFPPVSVGGVLLHDGGVAADVPLPQALDLRPSRIFVLRTMAEEPARRSAWWLLNRVFGRPSEPHEVPAHPGVEVHWLPAPAYVGNPYSFRASRQLIDQARTLADQYLDQTSKAKNIIWVA